MPTLEMTPLRIFGLALAGLGALASVFPAWFEPLIGASPEDAYQAIERRVRGGMVAGVGLAFVARITLRPWGDTLAQGIFYVLLGALLARLVGIVLEGSIPRQWMLVAVEAGLMVLPAVWLWRSGD